jgi:hypothetical protein
MIARMPDTLLRLLRMFFRDFLRLDLADYLIRALTP